MIVVDTNIVAGHCLPGPLNDRTEFLLQLEPEWAAPILWRSEIRSVLCGYLRRGLINLGQAGEIMLSAVETLKGGEHAVGDRAVLALVTKSECSAYDCEFVALAEALDTVLVTEDRQVRRAFPDRCRSLDEFINQRSK